MRLFGLIGYPLSHSFSKTYFAEKFKKEQINDCQYKNFEIKTIEYLPVLIKDNFELAGLNVTIPYKESVVQFLDAKNDLVAQTGACNCIKIISGKLIGFNTDVIGFERSLFNKLHFHPMNALILGTGGASKAVEFVLKKNGIQFKKVSRQSSTGGLSYHELTENLVKESLLIINASPVGMYPEINLFPQLPYAGITPKHFLFDLIYNPEKTLFLKKGEERGATIQNGYSMLVEQAEESWRIWNDTGVA